MSTVFFIVLKRPGRGADQLLQSLIPNLKEEMIYTYTVQWVPYFHCVKAAGAWFRPTTAIFSSEFEARDDLYLYCTMSTVFFIVLSGRGVVLNNYCNL
jgi:hypothetical protein